jgi:hypothetical protein
LAATLHSDRDGRSQGWALQITQTRRAQSIAPAICVPHTTMSKQHRPITDAENFKKPMITWAGDIQRPQPMPFRASGERI